MSNSLYEEAIADAMAIREAAESRAKQQLIESMTPQIKDLVEKKLMENLEAESEVVENKIEEDPNECGIGESMIEEDPDECGQMGEGESTIEEINIEESLEEDKDFHDVGGGYGIRAESFDVIRKLMTKNKIKSVVTKKINKLSENVKHLKKALLLSESIKINRRQKQRINILYKKLIEETKNIDFDDIIKSDRKLYETFIQLNKELQTMSRRRRRSEGFLNESLEDLLEMSLFLEDEGDDDDADKADADTDDLLSGLEDEAKADEAGDEADEADEAGEAGDLDKYEDLLDTDLRAVLDAALEGMSEDEDLDEGAYHEVEEDKDPKPEEVDQEQAKEAEGHDESSVLEIDEGMLRREIMKMKALREGDAVDMASHFGGGEASDEMFIEVDDSDLNVHADELGDAPRPSLKKEAAFRNVVRKNRLLESKLEEYAQALKGMKTQLSEMNLFNAKLLYANKLMQNKDLSVKQQRHIVESLDEAGTLNEAKLLFESLSKSLTKSRNSGSLNESANRRVLGSASKATRSAQPSKTQNVEVDRWATLAGIKK